MTYELTPVLAMTGYEIVFLVIVIASVVGPLISKHLKERKEQGDDTASTIGGASRQERLQQLAARRREQLRRLAEQRGTQPTNLTASQRSDRAQARSVYDRRAEALRRAQAQGRQQAQRAGPAVGSPVDQARARAQAQARAEAAKRAADAQVAAHAEQTARRQRQEQLNRQQRLDAIAQRERAEQAARKEARSKRDAALGAGARGATRSTTDSGTVRRVADADSSAYATDQRGESHFQTALKGSSLRDAIVLKEILDQPRATRPLEDLF